MSVGLLLITHNDIGAELLGAASRMLGKCPLQAMALAVTEDSELEELRAKARSMAEQVDSGEGVLVLTDLFGATPSNIANTLCVEPRRRVLAGVNLSMLVRVLNYPALPLTEMTSKALSGGRDGVLVCPNGDEGPDP